MATKAKEAPPDRVLVRSLVAFGRSVYGRPPMSWWGPAGREGALLRSEAAFMTLVGMVEPTDPGALGRDDFRGELAAALDALGALGEGRLKTRLLLQAARFAEVELPVELGGVA